MAESQPQGSLPEPSSAARANGCVVAHDILRFRAQGFRVYRFRGLGFRVQGFRGSRV